MLTGEISCIHYTPTAPVWVEIFLLFASGLTGTEGPAGFGITKPRDRRTRAVTLEALPVGPAGISGPQNNILAQMPHGACYPTEDEINYRVVHRVFAARSVCEAFLDDKNPDAAPPVMASLQGLGQRQGIKPELSA
jgi:hypothetical protein